MCCDGIVDRSTVLKRVCISMCVCVCACVQVQVLMVSSRTSAQAQNALTGIPRMPPMTMSTVTLPSTFAPCSFLMALSLAWCVSQCVWEWLSQRWAQQM